MIKLCSSIHLGIPLYSPSIGEQTNTSTTLRVMACALGILATVVGITILVGTPFLASIPVGAAYSLMAGGLLFVILSLCLRSIRAPQDLHRFRKSSIERCAAVQRRVIVFEETARECNDTTSDKRLGVDCSLMLQKTLVYKLDLPAIQSEEKYDTQFLVVREDTLNILSQYSGRNPVALSMANHQTPGGGVVHPTFITIVRNNTFFDKAAQDSAK